MDYSPLWLSLRVAFVATLMTFILGVLAAWLTVKLRRGKGIVDGLFTLPLVLPPTMVGFFLLVIFGKNGFIGQLLSSIGAPVVFTWTGAVIASTVVAFPLMYREFLGRFLIEKSNLILCYVLNTTGTLERWRALMPHPLLDTALVAAVNLPWLTFVSCAFALCRPDGRTLHDLVSGTMIMRD